jgi:acyl-CoA thioesterase FadM
MYPYIRTVKSFLFDSLRTKISLTDTHISNLICWPWDIDMWGELNNGRALSLFDLGRYGLSLRAGLFSGYFKHKIHMTVAGVSIRYRHRINTFRRLEMRTRVIFYDERFLYFEQVLLLEDGRCAVQGLIRIAVVENRKLVSPEYAAKKVLDKKLEPMKCPDWVKKWIQAEEQRQWPPELSN